MEEVVLLRVNIDEAGATRKAADLGLEISRLKSQQDALNLATSQGREEYIRLQAGIKSLQQQQSEQLRLLTAQKRAVDANTGSYRQLENQLKAATLKLRDMDGAFTKAEDGSIQLTKAYLDQRKEVEAAQQAIIDFNAAILQSNPINRNAGESINSIRERIQQLEQIANNADIGSDTFQKAKKQIDDLRISLEQAEGKINEFGDQEPKNLLKKQYDDAFESATALANSIQLLTSLAGEDEEAQVRLTKAVQAIAVAQTAANLIKSKGAIIDTTATIITKAQTAAQWLYTRAVGASTGALKLFRIALLASGIGIAVVLITEAAQAMGLFGSETDDTTDDINAQKQALDEYKRELEDVLEVQQQGRTANINSINREIDRLEASGASEAEIFQKKKERITEELQLERVRAATFVEFDDEVFKSREKIKDLENELVLLDIDRTNEARKQAEERKRIAEEEARKIYEVYFENKRNEILVFTEGARQKLALFDLEAQQELDKAEEQGLNLTLVTLRLEKERQALVDELNAEIDAKAIDTSYVTTEILKKKEDEITAKIAEEAANRVAYAEYVAERSKAEAEAELELRTQLTDNLLTLSSTVANLQIGNSRTAARFQRAAGIAQIGVDTARAISGAVAAAQAQPFPANLVAITTSLISVFKAISQAKQVISSVPKFAKGGAIDIGGNLHSEGGTKFYGEDGTTFEAERGESLYVVNRRARPVIAALSAINQATGGLPFGAPIRFAAEGGEIARGFSREVAREEASARDFADAISSIKPGEISIIEIEKRLSQRQRVREISSIG